MKTRIMTSLFALMVAVQPAMADKASNSINAAFGGEVATLDSYKATGREALVLARLLYDGLVSKDHTTGEFIPELATSWTVVSDTEMDFKIREGVKFHDGTTMTPEDVAYTLNLVSSKEYGARYSIAVSWIEKAEVLDDGIVRLTMKEPFPMALEMLAGNLPIYPKAYYEKAGPEGMAVNPVGTGPYKLVSMTQGVEFKFERFDDYYQGGQKGGAQIETLSFRVLPEQNTQYAELLNGDLDWIWRVPSDDIARLESRPGVKVEAAPIMRFANMAMNPHIEGSPVADVRVRKAINHAVNRPAIRDALLGKSFGLIDTPCNPIQFGCAQDVVKYDYDPAKAKALLAEAGYPDGFEADMIVSGAMPNAAEAVKANLAEVGIIVNLNKLAYAAATDQWRSGKAPLRYGNWGSYGIGDVGLSTGAFFNGGGDDLVKDPEVMTAIVEANGMIDREKRAALYGKAIRRIADEAYWVPLWTYSMNTAMAEGLNLSINPDEFVPFYDATWD